MFTTCEAMSGTKITWAQVNGNWELVGWFADQIAIEHPTKEDQALQIAIEACQEMPDTIAWLRQQVREEADLWPHLVTTVTQTAVAPSG